MNFSGYPPQALLFFKKLAKNNRKEWFDAKKDDYRHFVVEPSRQLVHTLNASRVFRKVDLKCSEKSPLFRINRDVRFSSDKSPYKTHNGMLFSHSGSRKDNGFWYMNIEPKNCFLAAGYWQPDPRLLARFRVWATENPKALKSLVAKLAKKNLHFDREDSLKRNPKGFEHVENAKLAEILRQKHWTVSRPLADSVLESSTLVPKIEKFCLDARPLLETLRPLYEEFLHSSVGAEFP